MQYSNSQGYCARTGDPSCKCIDPLPKVSALKVDLKCAMRKLWSDHAVFDAWVGDAIIDGSPALPALLNRLKQNQYDIGNQLKPLVNNQFGDIVTQALLQHIQTVGDFIKAKVRQDPQADTDYTQKMIAAAEEVGRVLATLNPKKLPEDQAVDMMVRHIQHIMAMGEARLAGDYEKELKIYDSYYNHLIELSDAIYNALF
jgi:hypothetical protein